MCQNQGTGVAVLSDHLSLLVTHNMKHAIDYGNRVVMLDRGKVKLELTGEAKSRATVPDLIAHFSVKTDRMLLES